MQEQALPLDSFIENPETYRPPACRARRCFNSATLGVPHALLHNLKHNKVLHERIVLMTVQNIDEPLCQNRKPGAPSSACPTASGRWWPTTAFKVPNVPEILDLCAEQGLEFEPMDTSFFLSRETLISPTAPAWRAGGKNCLSLQSKTPPRATDFFQIPANRVVEMGTQVEL